MREAEMWKGLVAFLVVALAAQAHAAPARRGDRAPAFTARDTTGKLVKLADLKGKQNLLLVFWSTDGCSTQDDLKAIEKLRARYRGSHSPSSGERGWHEGEAARQVAQGSKVTFPIWWMRSSRSTMTTGSSSPGVRPGDQKGVVQSRRVGVAEPFWTHWPRM